MKDEHQIVSIGEVLEDLNSPTFVADNEPYLVGIYIGAVYETPTGIDLREDTARGLLDAAREQAIDPQVMIGWLLDQVVRGKPTLSLVKDDGEGT